MSPLNRLMLVAGIVCLGGCAAAYEQPPYLKPGEGCQPQAQGGAQPAGESQKPDAQAAGCSKPAS